MPNLGTPELVVIFLIVILIFGSGRISHIGRELGTSITEFRKALNEDKQDEPETQSHK